jgi:hypothetical protein
LTVLNLGTAVRCFRGAGVSILRTAVVVWNVRTVVWCYPVGELEPIAGAAPPVGIGDPVESHQTGRTERGDCTRRGVLGSPDGGSDVSHTQWGGPTLVVSVRGEDEFLQSDPRQRAELAAPVSALRAEEQRAGGLAPGG